MIKFGTSGFRGIIGDNFTKENLQKIAFALNKVIEEDGLKNAQISIGYDNRFMSKIFAKWVAEVLSCQNKVFFYDVSVSSPLISWTTKEMDYGIMLTASHNPYYYNGIKVFVKGTNESDDILAGRITQIANNTEYSEIKAVPFENNKNIEITTNIQDYCNAVLSLVDCEKIRKSNIKVLANAMHGSGKDSIECVFDKLNLKTSTIMNANVDPYFENKLPAPYLYNLKDQADQVVKGGYDMGFALDGDGDRFTFIDKDGVIYDCNFVLCVLYYYLYNYKKIDGDIAKNKAFTNLINFMTNDYKKECYETKVGFKFIAEVMNSTNVVLGAETNGISYKPHTKTKDGVATAVMIIEALVDLKCSFGEVLRKIQENYNFTSFVIEYAYQITQQHKEEIIDMLFNQKKYPNFENRKIVQIKDDEGLKVEYENGYWGMIRFSGNEPVVRIFAEMENLDKCNQMIECYENFINVKERQK